MSKIVDSVDNRAGQMKYDNLFWNKSAKDLSFLANKLVGPCPTHIHGIESFQCFRFLGPDKVKEAKRKDNQEIRSFHSTQF